ncbi:MAG TPA: hypothetical protein VHP82_14150 [Gaiellaceae bacterium]|nr:hypothetical protein [Gaiellaceae bacterium]
MSTPRLSTLTVAAALFFGVAHPAAAAYGWPVKPFDHEHPVRGNFGDPRTVFLGPPTRRTLLTAAGSFQFHFGVDISAPNDTPVYPVESGVVTRVTDEEIVVAGPAGHSFEYWHLRSAVRSGELVTVDKTVLGRILKPAGHVHLSELEGGVYVNPLQRGHLTPYHDDTAPRVTRVTVRESADGVEFDAEAEDFPSLPVPGAWNGLPVSPARIAWRLETAGGSVVVPERVVFDVTQHLPTAPFWSVYERGTHQNMTAFTSFYAFRQPGDYIYRLGTLHVAPGAYRVVVTASDIRGNATTRATAVVLR